MKAKEIANRMTGFSTPFFGVQWTPAQLDVDVARKLVTFLEDRSVLYEPYEAEMPQYAVASVEAIRDYLTRTLDAGGLSAEFIEILRGMRSACRRFMRRVHEGPGSQLIVPDGKAAFDGGPSVWVFNQELGMLRGTFGGYLAQIAVAHDIDVPEPLSRCLPVGDADD